jgi:hypothetical protein
MQVCNETVVDRYTVFVDLLSLRTARKFTIWRNFIGCLMTIFREFIVKFDTFKRSVDNCKGNDDYININVIKLAHLAVTCGSKNRTEICVHVALKPESWRKGLSIHRDNCIYYISANLAPLCTVFDKIYLSINKSQRQFICRTEPYIWRC